MSRSGVRFIRKDRVSADTAVTKRSVLAFLKDNKDKCYSATNLLRHFVREPVKRRHERRVCDVLGSLARKRLVAATYDNGEVLYQHERAALAAG